MPTLNDRYRGMLLGTAVGDTIGLPAEGLSRTRLRKLFQPPWCHHFILGRGLISDDTEHTIFTTQCLLAHPDSVEAFAQRLGFCLKAWFASLPAGIGMATARACIRLCLGINPQSSGVFSAGNGPAMRITPIGAFFAHTPDKLETFTRACTTITHTDPKATIGAKAIALTAAWIVRDNLTTRPSISSFCHLLYPIAPADSDWTSRIHKMETGLTQNCSVAQFAESIGQGQAVTGYIYNTVPVVLFAWHRHFGNFTETLSSVINCGGDADTTGAIAAALAGLSVGETAIPPTWIQGIQDWPRSTTLIRNLADRLTQLKETGHSAGPIRYFWPGIPLRNTLFFLIVLIHGFRRLLPPY